MSQLAGKRALITGASGGIGAAIALDLARRGAHLVLCARRRAELDAVAAECATFGVEADVIITDLGHPDAAATLWTAATRAPPKMEPGGPAPTGVIDILVNNAGFGYFRPFGSIEWARDAELVQLNIASLVELSRLFIDHRRTRDGRAYLVNIASIAAYQSVPNMAVYAASKAFVRNFTEALHDELRGTSMSATCICPGGTKTDFHAMAGAGDYSWVANHSMMTAEQVARISVRAMIAGKRNVIPGIVNKLSCWGVRFVPRWFASWMSRRVLGRPRPGELPARTKGKAA